MVSLSIGLITKPLPVHLPDLSLTFTNHRRLQGNPRLKGGERRGAAGHRTLWWVEVRCGRALRRGWASMHDPPHALLGPPLPAKLGCAPVTYTPGALCKKAEYRQQNLRYRPQRPSNPFPLCPAHYATPFNAACRVGDQLQHMAGGRQEAPQAEGAAAAAATGWDHPTGACPASCLSAMQEMSGKHAGAPAGSWQSDLSSRLQSTSVLCHFEACPAGAGPASVEARAGRHAVSQAWRG